MRKRYSVFLSGVTTEDAQEQTITFNFDLRTLIPASERQKKFFLYSAFNTGVIGDANSIPAIEVGINLPQGFNKTFPVRQYLPIGVAIPTLTLTDNVPTQFYVCTYNEGSCLVKMIEYPEIYQIDVNIQNTNGDDIPDNCQIRLNLTFEECEEY